MRPIIFWLQNFRQMRNLVIFISMHFSSKIIFSQNNSDIHSILNSDQDDGIIKVSAKFRETILYHAKEWIKTESDEYGRSYSIVASNLINEIVRDDQTFPASCGYHRKCYQLFVVRQLEVPKSLFTYQTEGQFHFGFILFL